MQIDKFTIEELVKNQELLNKVLEISIIEAKENITNIINENDNNKIAEEYTEFLKIFENTEDSNTEDKIDKLISALEKIKRFSGYYIKNISNNSLITDKLKSIIPETFYITNNKLSNEITKDFVNKGQIELVVMKSRKKGDVTTYNSLTYDDENIKITGRYEFTAYDRAIHNAVCSLYVAGNDIVTPAMVYRTMNGMTETEYVSSQAIEAVKNSLDKSRFLRLRINFTEEAKARNINVDRAEIDNYLLPAKVITVEAGGNRIDAYKIYETPALYKYAQYTKQIISIPLELLDTKEATRNTEEIIPIKEYLIRRIEIMRHDRTMSNKILYDTIFEEAGIGQINRDKSYDLRKGIKAILNLWKNQNYIKDFQEYKQGNSIKGIKIFINERR